MMITFLKDHLKLLIKHYIKSSNCLNHINHNICMYICVYKFRYKHIHICKNTHSTTLTVSAKV